MVRDESSHAEADANTIQNRPAVRKIKVKATVRRIVMSVPPIINKSSLRLIAEREHHTHSMK